MRNPRTIAGYISMIRTIERISPMHLKGFDALPEKEKEILCLMDTDISNYVNKIPEKRRKRAC